MNKIAATWKTFRATVDMRPGLVLFGFILLACILMMIDFDRALAVAIKESITPEITALFGKITEIGRGEPWYAIALIVWAIAVWQGRIATNEQDRIDYARWAYSAKFMFWAMLVSGAAVILSKPLIGRLRPRYLFETGTYGFEPFNFDYAMNTFPSGHSQAIWSAMIALTFIFPKARWVTIPVAVIVSSSRAVLTVHFASDVLMGSFLGILAAVWVRAYFERDGRSVRLFG